jgi:class 3 adenylate cyclase
MSLAGAGEVMVSASTVPLLEGSGISFSDTGEHKLKGVDEKRRVYLLDKDKEMRDWCVGGQVGS